jgi:molybdate transport system substrate-binding protein
MECGFILVAPKNVEGNLSMKNVTNLLEISLGWLFLAALTTVSGHAHADTIGLYAAAGVKAPAEEIIQAFELQTGHKVTRLYDTAGEAEVRFVANAKSGGLQSSLLITTEVRIQKASAAGGSLTQGNTLRVGDTLAGVAISKQFKASNAAASHMDIGLAAGLQGALLAAKRIAFSDPARGATVGVHFAQVIEKLGIKDAVMAKAVIAKDGIETMKWVASGDVDLGITQMSEILQADRTLLLGAFPVELELATRYSSWVANDASAATKLLTDAFASEDGRKLLAKHGLRVAAIK